ncbi:PREDICTED: TSS [Prunus dulcis]|uniref:PREDICTED: TSS n=1 Tax=Prunus dulcis TaxID=3755 RepID=A0A5E4F1U7_PRUDU|nr:PREDICTED: TSS [Prunus dulcis]
MIKSVQQNKDPVTESKQENHSHSDDIKKDSAIIKIHYGNEGMKERRTCFLNPVALSNQEQRISISTTIFFNRCIDEAGVAIENVDADALSAKSIDFGPGIHLFETAPDFLKDILYADAMGVSRHRLVAA